MLVYNRKEVKKVVYNGNDVDRVVYNNIVVFEKTNE